jgi:hypothetical protein
VKWRGLVWWPEEARRVPGIPGFRPRVNLAFGAFCIMFVCYLFFVYFARVRGSLIFKARALPRKS